jgi:hypothetical protein
MAKQKGERIYKEHYIPMPQKGKLKLDIPGGNSSILSFVVGYSPGRYELNIAVIGLNDERIKDALDLRVDNRE